MKFSEYYITERESDKWRMEFVEDIVNRVRMKIEDGTVSNKFKDNYNERLGYGTINVDTILRKLPDAMTDAIEDNPTLKYTTVLDVMFVANDMDTSPFKKLNSSSTSNTRGVYRRGMVSRDSADTRNSKISGDNPRGVGVGTIAIGIPSTPILLDPEALMTFMKNTGFNTLRHETIHYIDSVVSNGKFANPRTADRNGDTHTKSYFNSTHEFNAHLKDRAYTIINDVLFGDTVGVAFKDFLKMYTYKKSYSFNNLTDDNKKKAQKELYSIWSEHATLGDHGSPSLRVAASKAFNAIPSRVKTKKALNTEHQQSYRYVRFEQDVIQDIWVYHSNKIKRVKLRYNNLNDDEQKIVNDWLAKYWNDAIEYEM